MLNVKVRFFETVTVEAVDGETFKKGRSYSMNEASARHWISRGLAEAMPDKAAARAAEEEAATAKEETPAAAHGGLV